MIRYGTGNPTECLFFSKVEGDDNNLETPLACTLLLISLVLNASYAFLFATHGKGLLFCA